LLFRETPD